MGFRKALDQVLLATHDGLREAGIRWAVVGSGASVLQGVSLIPGDIDLLMETPAGVWEFARLMEAYAQDECAAAPGSEDWMSSRAVPVLAGNPDPEVSVWHFGRWLVCGFRVEAAHIEPPDGYLRRREPGAGMWECGPEIWEHLRTLRVGRYEVAMVPIEIQLETCMSRGLDNRALGILEILRQSCDSELLDLALSERHRRILKDRL